MRSTRRQLARFGGSSVGRSTGAFVALSATSSALAAISTGLLAGLLSTDGFAGFTLSKSILALVATIFEFGIFMPAARLGAMAKDEVDRRSWLGATMAAFLPIGLLYVLAIAALSLFVDSIFTVPVGDALLVTAPLAFAYPFAMVALSVSQASGRAFIQPLMTAVAGAIFLGGILAVQVADYGDLSLTVVLAIRGAAFLAGAIVVVLVARPLFRSMKSRWRRIWSETLRWGMQAYAGRLISVGTYNVDVLIVGALTDPDQLGAYGLAAAAANLILIPAVGLGTSLFPRMTRATRLDRRPIVAVVVLGLFATTIGAIVARPLIEGLLNPALGDAALYFIPLGLASTVRAVTSIINAYMNAHAAGRALRNTSIILFVSNVTLVPVMILAFGGLGAAIASLLAMLANLAGYLYYLRRLNFSGE